jgi:dihydrofolate synthase/folylpolyglutamate synthase
LCGYRIGLFTSPHLQKINERIKINNIEISNQDLMKYIKLIRPYIKRKHGASPVKYRKLSGAPAIKHHEFHGVSTFFEVLTMVAFLHFLKKKTDFSILEVGLGGRLDSTNVTHPIISVITKIGYDHTNLLGNKLSQITREKAGIIKNNGILITIHQRPSVQKIINRVTHSKKCSIIFAEDQYEVKILKQSIKGSYLKINGEIGKFNTFLPLPGKHQVENLLIAMSVLNELRKKGYAITEPAIQNGIKQTDLHGRFEVLSKNPLLIYDCAHNDDSFEALGNNLRLLGTKKFSLIFGCKQNKDIRYCLKNIFPRAQEVVIVKAFDPPGMEPHKIYKRAKKYQKNLTIASSVKNAIEYLKTKNSNNTAIIITGTFYLWNEIGN